LTPGERSGRFAGKVAVDGVCLEAVGQFRQQLFRPRGVCVVTSERRFGRDAVFRFQIRSVPVAVVGRVQSLGSFVRNECAMSHRAITSQDDRDWIAPHPSRGTKNAIRRSVRAN
jgi:hypothetical protein